MTSPIRHAATADKRGTNRLLLAAVAIAAFSMALVTHPAVAEFTTPEDPQGFITSTRTGSSSGGDTVRITPPSSTESQPGSNGQTKNDDSTQKPADASAPTSADTSTANPTKTSQSDIRLISVTFDGTPGTTPAYDDTTGTWTTVTPAHASGPVTMIIDWTQGGTGKPQAKLIYNYLDVPAYEVTFDPAGGKLPEGSAPCSGVAPGKTCQTIAQGDTVSMPVSSPTRKDWVFDGWFINSTPYDFTQNVTRALKLTAHWSKFSVTPDKGSSQGGTPVGVTPSSPVRFFHVSNGADHSLALGTDGSTWAWGNNESGQLGNGVDSSTMDGGTADSGTTITDSGMNKPVKVRVPAGVRFTQVSAGPSYSLALGDDGNIYAWGSNQSGQLGIVPDTDAQPNSANTPTNRNTPVKVTLPSDIKAKNISAGSSHALALGVDGNIYAWGTNDSGQLGDGSNTSQPVAVKTAAPDGTQFVSISAGNGFSLAISNTGTTYAWGTNAYGQLGDDTTVNRNIPASVSMPTGIFLTQVSAGNDFSTAIGNDGNIWAWGKNQFGQLGDGTTASRMIPGKVELPSSDKPTQVSAGASHVVTVTSDGTAWSWGLGGYNQLGNDSTANHGKPVKVSAPEGVAFEQVSASGNCNTAVGKNGNTYSWGTVLSHNTTQSQPTQLSLPAPQVTRVTFGTLPGAEPAFEQPINQWMTKTPAHKLGKVNVSVTWNLGGGESQTASGFTYTYVKTASSLPLTGSSATWTYLIPMLLAAALITLAAVLSKYWLRTQ